MRGAKSAKWVAGAAVVALAATACGGGDGDSKGKEGGSGGVISMEIGEPQNLLVPSNTYETEGGQVIHALFTGLTKLNEKSEVVNDLAQSVETKDSKVWTIKLKPGYTFHNGEAVTAKSFIDGWNYGANQDNAQQTNPSSRTSRVTRTSTPDRRRRSPPRRCRASRPSTTTPSR